MVQSERPKVPRPPRAPGCDPRGMVVALLSVLVLLAVSLVPALAEGKRVALVIGNSNYQHVRGLPNPVNDANDLSASLTSLGFAVTLKTDLDKRGMDRTLADFARTADGADVALVFYAGHGLQYEGRNYIVPVDAELKDEIAIQYDSVPIDDLIGTFARVSGARVLVIDACRDSPVPAPTGAQPLQRGLARMSSPRGMLIASATQANEVAFDGTGRNGVFTGAILETLKTPGLEVHELFRRVTGLVNEESGGQQTPEMSSSIVVPLVLNAAETAESVWSRIRDADDPTAFVDFIARYPDSLLVDAARARIELLRRAREQSELEDQIAALQAGQTAETEQRQADATRAAEAARLDEANRKAEADRAAAETQQAEQARVAEEARRAEEARVADDARKAEEARLADLDRERRDEERLAKINDLVRVQREQEALIRKAEEAQSRQQASTEEGGSTAGTETEVASLGNQPSEGGGLVLQPSSIVRSLQLELARVGCRSSAPDGVLDAATLAELRTYLAAAGLDQTLAPDNPKLLQRLRDDRMSGCRTVAQKAPPKADMAKMCASLIERLQAGDEPTAEDRAALETYCR